MARVDPNDDSVPRWVVSHYRYDPDQRERTWIDVVAFDSQDEFESYIDEATATWRRLNDRGGIATSETYRGSHREAGYRDRMNRQRIERESFIRRARANAPKRAAP
jgi:hypothetical protein